MQPIVEQSIAQLELKEGMRVAEFGSGMGFYTRVLSERVGKTGKVFAIEIQKEVLKKLEEELHRLNIMNVEYLWADVESKGGSMIADQSMDAVIMANVLFQAEDKIGMIDEAKRILKRNGKILLIDHTNSLSGLGASSDMILTEESTKELFEKRELKFLKKAPADMFRFGSIFVKER